MTLTPQILEISNGADLISEWTPEYTRLFHITITIVIRFMEDDMNLYYLDVTTPEFIYQQEMPNFVKKLLILEEYVPNDIIEFINKVVFEKSFTKIEDAHEHIHKFFRWEFDDYYLLPGSP